MFAKFFLLAFLTFSAQTLSEAKSIDNYGLLEETQKIVEQLVAIIREVADGALAIIHDLYENLQGQAKEQVEAALVQLRALAAEAKAKLQQALNEAAELGQEAVACVNGEKDNLIALAEKSQAEMNACKDNLINDAREVVNTVVSGVKGNIKSVTDLWEKFTNCGGVFCQIGVIANISEVVGSIKADIATYVATVKEFSSTGLVDLKTCTTNALKDYTEESNVIKGRIVACMKAIN